MYEQDAIRGDMPSVKMAWVGFVVSTATLTLLMTIIGNLA